MLSRLQRYRTLLSKSFLFAGYLFFFAGQFNGRYFTIANFYVYHSNGKVSNAGAHPRNTNAATATRTTTGQHPVALQDNSQRPAHLGIDKRYQFQQGMRISQIRAPGVIYTALVKTRLHSQTQVCLSIDLPTNALRGPPCA